MANAWPSGGQGQRERPADAASRPSRSDLIGRLTARIRAIEGRCQVLEPPAETVPSRASQTHGWRLGVPEIDRRLGPRGLETAAVHEIKPACHGEDGEGVPEGWAGAVSAALAFTLMLGKRLLIHGAATGAPSPPILWCWPAMLAGDLGGLYVPGLASLGLDQAGLIVVEPAKSADVLWAMEEGLRSGGPSLVVGVLGDIGLTPARRLALAAAAGATPCLIVTDPRTPVTGATATRWRIGRTLSAPHPLSAWLDDTLPGVARYHVMLERNRVTGVTPMSSPLVLEWSDASHRFHLAATSTDRAPAEGRARRHPGR